MGTYIHGIAASQNIDSSGERIIIAGLDISSLERDGVFNYEHDQGKTKDGEPVNLKIPQNIVGKILKARKIFQESDCEDEHQKYFWDKCQCPYLYVMGELMDDYKESAKEVAGMFMYDADRKGKQEANVANFSVEGNKIKKEGIDLVRSIARKVTITTHPCNKAAISEIVPNPQAKPKDDLDNLFKTESVMIEVFKFEPPKPQVTDMAKHAEALGIEPMEKAEKKPGLPQASAHPGTQIGQTKSGKPVMSHQKIHTYQDFHAEDHRNAANLHGEAANKANAAKNWKLADHHNQKMKLHNSMAAGMERKHNRLATGMKQRKERAALAPILGKSSEATKIMEPTGRANRGEAVGTGVIPSMGKAMTADSGLAAPGNKNQGAALNKTYASEAQRRWAHTPSGKKALGGEKGVKEWDEKSKGKKLPERVEKSDSPPPPPPPPPPTLGETATRGGTTTINAAIGNPFGKDEKLNKPLFNKVPGKSTTPGLKAGMGMSNMGAKVREGNIDKAKQIAKKTNKWLARAEQEYAQWNKREQFQEFMAKRMPHLTKGEIDAIGQTLALKKSLDAEQSLEIMVKGELESKKDK